MSVWYRAGTIAATNGSATITGTGTAWNGGQVQPGHMLVTETGAVYEIESVASDTSITLATPFLGLTAGGLSYAVAPTQGVAIALVARINTLLETYSDARDVAAAIETEFEDVLKPSYQAQVDNLGGDIRGDFPQINLLSDWGSFSDGHTGQNAGAFVPPEYFLPFNGTSTFVEVGKAIDDNDTFGGTAGALHPDVEKLFNDMAVPAADARFGIEFYVAEATQGTGTAIENGSTGTYLTFLNGSRALPLQSTFRCFVRAKTGTASVSFPHQLDGVDTPDTNVIADDNWHLVTYNRTLIRGYDNRIPRICASPSAVIQIACPALLSGANHVLPTTSVRPIPTGAGHW